MTAQCFLVVFFIVDKILSQDNIYSELFVLFKLKSKTKCSKEIFTVSSFFKSKSRQFGKFVNISLMQCCIL
jgi:hypothetical protein